MSTQKQITTAKALYRKELGPNWKKSNKKQVKKAYRSLALKNHPDRGGDQHVFAAVAEVFRLIEDLALPGEVLGERSIAYEEIWKNFAHGRRNPTTRGASPDFGGWETSSFGRKLDTYRDRIIIISSSDFVLKSARTAFAKGKRQPVSSIYGGGFWNGFLRDPKTWACVGWVVNSGVGLEMPESWYSDFSGQVIDDKFMVIDPQFGVVPLDATVLLRNKNVSEKAFASKLKRQIKKQKRWKSIRDNGVGEYQQKKGKTRYDHPRHSKTSVYVNEVFLFGDTADKDALMATGFFRSLKWIPSDKPLKTQKRLFSRLLKDHPKIEHF